MFKRIVVVLAVAVTASAAVFAWSETPGERQFADKSDIAKITPDAAKVAQAYRIEKEGRRLHAPYATERDLLEAREKYLEALSIFRSLNHEQGQAEALLDLEILYRDLDQHEKAAEYSKKLLEFKKKLSRSWIGGNILANIGNLFGKQSDYAKAAKCYEQAVKAYVKGGDTEFTGRALYDLGQVYRKLGKYPKATECLERSLGSYPLHNRF